MCGQSPSQRVKRDVSVGLWWATIESCHSDKRAASAWASGVPTVYPTDLYRFMGVISNKRTKDHAAAYAARAVYGRSKGGCPTMRSTTANSTVALTKATSAPRQLRVGSRVNGVADGHEGVSDCADDCILKCLCEPVIDVLQAKCSAKHGVPIARTISMDVHITGNNISKQLRRYMERSLSTALGDAAERVVAVEVELSGVNKGRTRHDTLCGIRAELRRAGVVFVHGRSPDAHTAVDRAGLQLKIALTTWPASRTYGRFDSAS